MRRVIAVALSLAVQAAALSAPLVHAHPDDHATRHHSGPVVHTHWAGHAHSHDVPEALALQTADHDRAVFLDAFVAVPAPLLAAAAASPGAFELPVPRERAPHRVTAIAHSHDPPFLNSLSSRAPPAFLS